MDSEFSDIEDMDALEEIAKLLEIRKSEENKFAKNWP